MVFNYKKIRTSLGAIRRIFRGYGGRIVLMTILGFLAGFSGSFGIGAVLPLFSLITNTGTVVPDSITNITAKIFNTLGIPFTLPAVGALIAGLFIFKVLVQYCAKYVNNKTGAEYEEKMRTSLIRKTLNADWLYLLNQKSGYLERVIMSDVTYGVTVINLTTNLILFASSFITYAFVAFNISPAITFLTIIFGAFSFWLSKPFFRRAKKMAIQMSEFEKEVSHLISQNLIGAKMIKAEAAEDQVIGKSKKIFSKLRELKIKMTIYQYSLNSAFEPVALLFVGILFILYYRLPQFNLISFAAIVYLIQKMFAFIQSAQNNVQKLNEVIP